MLFNYVVVKGAPRGATVIARLRRANTEETLRKGCSVALTFQSTRELILWLRVSDAGQRILERVRTLDTDAELKARIHERRYEWLRQAILEREGRTQHVLIEVFPDGWAEVYGPRSVRVKVVKRPRTATIDLHDERLQRLTDSQLKQVWRDVYWPSNLLMSYDHSVPTLHEAVCHAEYMEAWSRAFPKPVLDKSEFKSMSAKKSGAVHKAGDVTIKSEPK